MTPKMHDGKKVCDLLGKQSDRFREAARALECDDDEAHFDAKLKKVASASKPNDEKAEKKGS